MVALNLHPLLDTKETWRSNARNCIRVTTAFSVTAACIRYVRSVYDKKAGYVGDLFIYLFIYYTFCQSTHIQLNYRM